jgi:Protein of unknown function (DUF1579)
MKGIRFVVACSLAVVLAWAAFAQALPEMKPTPEHAKLGYYVGEWQTEGEMKASPFGPGGKVTSQDDCQWFEGKLAVICHGQGNGPMGPTKTLGILGYSPEEKVYTYYGLDNSAMTMMSIPRGTISGDTWTYEDESKMGGQRLKSRFVVKQLSSDAYTFEWELRGEGGPWNTVMEGKSTRRR